MRRTPALATAALIAAGLAVPFVTTAASAAATASCSAATSRTIVATLKGSDGKALNAKIGFDLATASGQHVDAVTGCATSTYGANFRINKTLGAAGSTKGTTTVTIRNVPANVKKLYAEVYLVDSKGNFVTSRYGWTVRQNLPVAAKGRTTVTLVAPLKKATGALKVTLSSSATHMLAFSRQADDTKVVSPGWYLAKPDSSGKVFLFPALAAGQTYVLTLPGGRVACIGKLAAGKTTQKTNPSGGC